MEGLRLEVARRQLELTAMRLGEVADAAPARVQATPGRGKRVYFSNSLYSPWDEQIYPDGLKSWMVKLDADPNG